MGIENKRFVLKRIKFKLKNKEERYKKLYRDAVRQYKFLAASADVRKVSPNPNKKEREYQLKLVDYCHNLLSAFEKEGINYFLAYGNLLGAIRHGGFIPWDDDFDVELLREDYEKLKVYCEKHFIKIPIEESLYNDYYRFQVLDKYMKRYPNQVLYLLNPDCIKLVSGTSITDSLQLDCIVLDYFDDNCDIKQHWNYLAKVRDIMTSKKTDKEVLEFFAQEVKNNKNVLKNQISSKIYYGIDSWSSYDRYRAVDFFKKEDYFPIRKIKFEGKEFLAPNNPEPILSLHYGNLYTFPGKLELNRHVEKQRKSGEKVKKLEEANQSKKTKPKKEFSYEKKLVLKRLKNKFSSKLNSYKAKYRKKYAEVKFLKSIIDVNDMTCGDKELRRYQLDQFSFCKKMINIINQNDLKYALCGGSLIGAIRHKGFIPWDDDFDVVMMREDYTKILKYAKENFIELPLLKNFDRIHQFKMMNEYMEKYPNKIIFLHHPHWLRFFQGTNLLDSRFFEIFVLDYFDDNYTMAEHKKCIEKIKLKKIKVKNYKELFQLYENESKINKNIVEKSSKIYYGIDSLGSYVINPEKFMTQDMLFPLKKLKFEDMELCVPNNYQDYIKIQYNDYSSFPTRLSIAPFLKEKREMYKIIKKKFFKCL